jgi:glutathione S-transferase
LRQLLEYCGLPYSEAKYVGPEDRTRWNEEVKPKLILKNPAVTLPYLQDGDKVISESDAISLYICFKANKPELTGRDPEEKVAMATAWGVFKDIHIQFVGLCYGMHGLPSWETAVAEYPKRFRSYLQKFKGLLGEKEFMAGNLTFVDFGIAEFFQALSLLFP